jgi:hypothetical protein
MFSAIARPIRVTLTALVATESSSQLAAGFALGLVIAIAPQGNLIALSLGVLLFSLRCSSTRPPSAASRPHSTWEAVA